MVAPVPEGYHRITPYLVVADGEGLIAFVRNAFGAEVLSRTLRPDGTIANAEVRIGERSVLNFLLRPMIKSKEAFRER